MGNYYVKPRIYMEREGLREILKGVTRAFIVTDKFMHESGKVSYLTDVLDQMGIAYEIFSEVKPDPDIATDYERDWPYDGFKPQALLALAEDRRLTVQKPSTICRPEKDFLKNASLWQFRLPVEPERK